MWDRPLSNKALFPVLAALLAAPALMADERPEIRVGCLSILPHLPVLIADRMETPRRGTFDVALSRYNSDTSIEAALRVGAIDVAAISAPVALAMAADGVDIRVIGSCHRGGSRVVGKGVRTLDDLRGKVVGVPGLDSSESLTLVEASTSSGLRPGLDFKSIGVSLRNVVDVFSEGKLDAIYLPEPFGAMATARVAEAAGLDEGAAAFSENLGSVLVARVEILETRSKLLEGWLELVVTACRLIEKDIADTGGRQSADLMSEFSACAPELVKRILVSRLGGLRFDSFLVDPGELRAYLSTARRMQIITNSVDIRALLEIGIISRVIEK